MVVSAAVAALTLTGSRYSNGGCLWYPFSCKLASQAHIQRAATGLAVHYGLIQAETYLAFTADVGVSVRPVNIVRQVSLCRFRKLRTW